MITADLFIELSSYWHAGTGRGAGHGADAVVFTTAGGLPCLPGKTVKGLLKDAVANAVKAGVLADDELRRWFGAAGEQSDDRVRDRVRDLEAERFTTTPGALRFDSAVIGDSPEASARWEAWAAQNPAERARLFHYVASTKLDENGVAADKTLRRIEVAVPMTLRAQVSSEAALGEAWVASLQGALAFFDGVGSHRNRGLGRATARLVKR